MTEVLLWVVVVFAQSLLYCLGGVAFLSLFFVFLEGLWSLGARAASWRRR
jgi:hypothetical protein